MFKDYRKNDIIDISIFMHLNIDYLSNIYMIIEVHNICEKYLKVISIGLLIIEHP